MRDITSLRFALKKMSAISIDGKGRRAPYGISDGPEYLFGTKGAAL